MIKLSADFLLFCPFIVVARIKLARREPIEFVKTMRYAVTPRLTKNTAKPLLLGYDLASYCFRGRTH